MKSLVASLLLFAASCATAGTVGPGCVIAWDYEVEDEQRIDGFRLYQGTIVSGTALPSAREMTCSSAGVLPGANTMTATAYNAVDESEHSNAISFVFVDSAPGTPSNVRVVVSIP